MAAKGELVPKGGKVTKEVKTDDKSLRIIVDSISEAWREGQKEETRRLELQISAANKESTRYTLVLIGGMALLAVFAAWSFIAGRDALGEKLLFSLVSFIGGVAMGWRLRK